MKRRTFLQTTSVAASAAALGVQAEAGSEKPPGHTNLLFIMTDQQRWDALSRAGNSVLETPNLDRLSREGVFFENAFTACPVCAPARTSMLTGHCIQSTGVGNNRVIDRADICPMPTYDEILASTGYKAEYYGKWHAPTHRGGCYENTVYTAGRRQTALGPGLGVHYKEFFDKHVPLRDLKPGELIDRSSRRPYLPDPLDLRYGLSESDFVDEKGKPKKYSQAECYGCLDVPPEYTRTSLVANETIEAIERLKDEPFTIHCSLGPPHPPMVLPKPYYGMYPPEAVTPPASIHDPMDNSPYAQVAKRMARYRDKSKIGYMISDYFGLVREIDDYMGKILDKLQELGLENNTLVIFTSDHGEMLGSHGMREKNVFYEEAVHVPLLKRLPGVIPAGSVVSRPVSQIDLFATILDYLGTQGSASHGQSLRDVIEGKETRSEDYIVSEWDYENVPNFMLRTPEWKFLFARSERPERLDALYNRQDDPLEMNNLIGANPKRAQSLGVAAEMKDRLVDWLEKTENPFLESVKERKIG